MFGITSAPENYQKIVKDVLRDCKGVANIADDLIVHGRSIQEHDENLFAVLHRLRECWLTLDGNKCKFRLPQLTFYGHDLGNHGIAPSEEKVAAILNAKSSQTASEVRSFLGLVQYSAKFIPNFAEQAEALRILTRKDQVFIWGDEQERAFQELKKLMTRAETLTYFRNDCRTQLIADAGPTGLGQY